MTDNGLREGMGHMVELLRDNPLLLLFLVVVIGYPLGRIRVAGSTIGVASVLFAGLAVGAVDEELRLPEIVYLLGLVLFVYTIGLSSGPGFFASFRRKGLQYALFVVGMLVFASVLLDVLRRVLGLDATTSVGVFAGALTNTPSLAGVLDALQERGIGGTGAPTLDALLAEPVVAYSVAYPMGVIGAILAIALLRRLWRIDYAAEAARVRDVSLGTRQLLNRTLRVTQPQATERAIHELTRTHGWNVVFGRVQHGERRGLVSPDTRLELGDLVSVIGAPEDVERVTAAIGEPSGARLELDRSELDFRRIFVSNPAVAGHRLRDLNLPQHYGALVTRVRRGDVEFVPQGDTVLELGDRVRVVTSRENMDEVGRFLGDSYRALSEIDVLTFSLGLAAGLLLGVVPIPLPGDVTLRLGLAGGPLLVALTLGALGRTGPFVWGLPYSANLTLRQVGLILFLAGIGTRAGHAFISTLREGDGLLIFAAGAILTCVTMLTALSIGYHLLKIPMGLLLGIIAGLQTQPAVLGFALEETKDDLPNVGYAAVFPVVTIAKILLAQVLLAVWM
jgi:putative transport protein